MFIHMQCNRAPRYFEWIYKRAKFKNKKNQLWSKCLCASAMMFKDFCIKFNHHQCLLKRFPQFCFPESSYWFKGLWQCYVRGRWKIIFGHLYNCARCSCGPTFARYTAIHTLVYVYVSVRRMCLRVGGYEILCDRLRTFTESSMYVCIRGPITHLG